MAKTKEEKKIMIGDLGKKIEEKEKIIFLDFSGLSSDKLFDLRKKLRDSECDLKIVKKNLLKKVLEKAEEKEFLQGIEEIEGQLALVFSSEDELAPSKICYQSSKENENLKILGGASRDKKQNQKYILLTPEEIDKFAQLPSREELLFKLVYSLKSPISGLANVFKGNIKGLICVLAKAKA